MTSSPDTHRRRSIRLRNYDYSKCGAYYVTVCCASRECLLGRVADGRMHKSAAGEVVEACWNEIPAHFARVQLDDFVVMPNHAHGIIILGEGRRGVACYAPTRKGLAGPRPGSLGAVVRSFKSAATRRIAKTRGGRRESVWQPNYYEHVMRNESDLNRIRQYIRNNPRRWHLDRENRHRVGEDEFDLWLASFRHRPGQEATHGA